MLSKEKNDVRFLNIGANDGLSNDPLTEFIFTKHWKGLLIEPVTPVFNRLKAIYGKNPNVQCINAAISDMNSEREFYYIESAPELHPGVDQIGSFSKEHVMSHKDFFPGCLKHFKTVNIKCKKLQSVLDESDIGNVDLYLIDTEGYDYHIIKQIDFKKTAPSLIIFEHLHLSKKEKKEAFRLLRSNHYYLKIGKANTIAKLKS